MSLFFTDTALQVCACVLDREKCLHMVPEVAFVLTQHLLFIKHTPAFMNTHTQTHIHIDIPCSVFSMVSRRSVFIFFTLLHNCVFPPSFTQLCVRNVNSLEMNEWVFLSVWEKVNYCKTAEICVTLALSCFYVHSPTQQSSVKACFHR